MQEKVVLVAGAGDNMGRAIPVLLAQEGAHLVLVSRNRPELEQTAHLCAEAGGQVESLQGDVTVEVVAREAVDRAVVAFGRLDGLVTAAGGFYQPQSRAETLQPNQWDQALTSLMRALFLFSRASIPAMEEQGGGSVVALGAAPQTRLAGGVAYSAGKEGLTGLVRRLARESWARNVRVNLISPGLIWEPLGEGPIRPVQRKHLAGYGSAADIAYAALYLLSDEASWVTGTELIVDGGDDVMATPPERGR
ncbi:SDR family NAD(P)-dependent oxidoreductase [Limnochorda pilosa]|nr:SDR family oxidoreductase [Limnochorda pilosa]